MSYADNYDATTRKWSNLKGKDFSGADLSYKSLIWLNFEGANFYGTNFQGSNFEETILEGANLEETIVEGTRFGKSFLRGAKLPHKEITPIIENIHQKVYEAASKPEALNMRDWHTCKTTHSRGGWVIALAGEAGKKLEEKIGSDAAASLIYMASYPELEQIPDWFASKEEALADMKRLTEQEQTKGK